MIGVCRLTHVGHLSRGSLWLTFGLLLTIKLTQMQLNCLEDGVLTLRESLDREIKNEDEFKLARSICSNSKTKLDSSNQILRLIKIIGVDSKMCKQRYLASIFELDPILKCKRDNLCSDEAFRLMRDYHFRFIQPPKDVNRRPSQFEPLPRELVKGQLYAEPRRHTAYIDEHDQALQTPIAIRHFFLKFALQVSLTCKRNLLSNLNTDSARLLTEVDRDIMLMFDRDTPIGKALGPGLDNIDFDSALYLPELDGKLKGEAGARLEARKELDGATGNNQVQHLKTTANENSSLFQMIFACRKRFKPIYDQLIVPVTRLSKLGYDYQGPELSEMELYELTGTNMKKWLGLMHVCELFNNVNVIILEGPAMKKRQVSEAPKTDLIGEKQEEDKVEQEEEGKFVEVESEQEIQELKREAEHQRRFDQKEQLVYEPSIRHEVPDELIIKTVDELNLELSRKQGNKNPFGLRGIIRKTSDLLLRMLAKLDLERFTHYRHNSLWYSGVLNAISSISNVASITVTVLSIFGVTG